MRSPTGSSPRGRGKPLYGDVSDHRKGIIPARAGKTASCFLAARLVSDHPRAGGENVVVFPVQVVGVGSSPRGRGKRRVGVLGEYARGIIPARAGKTVSFVSVRGARWDHPRAGGENLAVRLFFLTGAGSSPRGRGKRVSVHNVVINLRIIPARAGKTRYSPTSRGTCTDHPRAGGENSAFLTFFALLCGSSPRGRGKPSPPDHGRPPWWIIPARAGKTNGAVRFAG